METRTRIDTEKLHLIAARLKLWVLDLVLWLAAWLGRSLPRDVRIDMRCDVREALDAARLIVVALALAQWAEENSGDKRPARTTRPHGAPLGFRRPCPGNNARGLKRCIRLRGRTLAEQLAAVRDVLETLGVWVARMRARMRRLPHGALLVLCFRIGEVPPAPVVLAAARKDSS